ncbi:MAG: hypothetical protein JO336_23190, partial [Acidobacteriia bacterium]|nr:hypothetical protein [Terriglobia bacterium]
MGNRGGALHNDQREIVRPYKDRRWIACVLEFRGRKRSVMTPNRYTELFFLDEAVAFSAGHRPCFECRRKRFLAFQDAWQRARQQSEPPRAMEMDAELHCARIQGRAAKVTYQAPLDSLPNGTFIELAPAALQSRDREGAVAAPCLIWNDAVYLWTPQRYTQKRTRPRGISVTVLTPRPIVECFRAGYIPEIHSSFGTL